MALLPAIAPISESRSRRLITVACSRRRSRMKIGSLQILLASRPESKYASRHGVSLGHRVHHPRADIAFLTLGCGTPCRLDRIEGESRARSDRPFGQFREALRTPRLVPT